MEVDRDPAINEKNSTQMLTHSDHSLRLALLDFPFGIQFSVS